MEGVGVDMIVVKCSVHNQRLRKINSVEIPLNAYGKVKFEFDFRTNDWDAVSPKTANFYYNGENYPVELDANNQCYPPKEITYSFAFNVSVFGGDIVTNTIRIPVEGKRELAPNVYEDIMKLIEDHTHDEYVEDDELENVLPDTFDAGTIIERS